MATRHGRVARTPVSLQDPQTLESPRTPEPTPGLVSNGLETATRDELGRLAEALLDHPTYQQKWRQDLALARILDWLETFPGEDWQERWLLSGSDHRGHEWGPPNHTPALRSRLTAGLRILIVSAGRSPVLCLAVGQPAPRRLRDFPAP